MSSDSLSSFYTSRKWRSLLTVIRNERVDEDGFVICAYCGKPIVREYDCIGHHKIELTEENVNDALVALNPDNIELVHHRCHNYIHDKLGYSTRQVFLVYGAPCSGKTTFVRNSKQDGDLVVDLDAIWQCVSGCAPYVKPNKLKSVVFKIRDELLDAVRVRFGKWDNAYIVGGYPLQSERERLVHMLGAREVFVDTPREECLRRAEADELKDSNKYAEYIAEWFENYREDEIER